MYIEVESHDFEIDKNGEQNVTLIINVYDCETDIQTHRLTCKSDLNQF